jgi:hypothetical protein
MLPTNSFRQPRVPLSVNGNTRRSELPPPSSPPAQGSPAPSGPLSLASVPSSSSADGEGFIARVVQVAAASSDDGAPYLDAAQAAFLSRTSSQPPLPGAPEVELRSTPAPSPHASTPSSPTSGGSSPIGASVESDTQQSLIVSLQALRQVPGSLLLDLSAVPATASACIADVCENCCIDWRSCPCVAACATCGQARPCCQCAVFNWTAHYERLDKYRPSLPAPQPPSLPPSPPPSSPAKAVADSPAPRR